MANKIILPTTHFIITAEDLAQARSEAESAPPKPIRLEPIRIQLPTPEKSPSRAARDYASRASADYRIDRAERKQLLRMGYGEKRLAKLAGSDGWAPMRRKMLWYGETVKHTSLTKSDAQGWMRDPAPLFLKKFSSEAYRNPQAAKQAVPSLTQALSDSRREIRFQAAEALGHLPPQAARRALPLLLQKMEKETDVQVFDSLRKGALRIGLAPKNLQAFVLALASRRLDFLENRLGASFTEVSDKSLEAAHAELQSTRFATPRVRYVAKMLDEALSEEYAARGKTFPKSPRISHAAQPERQAAQAKLEIALEIFR